MNEPGPASATAEDIDEAAARRNQRAVLLFILAIAVIGVVTGLTIALLAPHHRTRSGHHLSGGQLAGVLAIVIPAIVLTVGVGLYVVLRVYRRPTYRRVLQYS